MFLDPLPEAQRPEGEGPDGVAVHWHPDALLLRHRALMPVVDRWRTGARREIDAETWNTASHWEIEAVLTMKAAADRAKDRRLEAMRDEYAHGAGSGQPR